LFLLRIVAHLDDEQPAELVERHRHRINHKRLGCHELNPKSVRYLKAREGFLR
jgi:hypothetical protein